MRECNNTTTWFANKLFCFGLILRLIVDCSLFVFGGAVLMIAHRLNKHTHQNEKLIHTMMSYIFFFLRSGNQNSFFFLSLCIQNAIRFSQINKTITTNSSRKTTQSERRERKTEKSSVEIVFANSQRQIDRLFFRTRTLDRKKNNVL